MKPTSPSPLRIGWAQADILPEKLPVIVTGQFAARVSEEVRDPLIATALALRNEEAGVVFVTCDLVAIPRELRAAVRERLKAVPGLDPRAVILNATHTHTGPEIRLPSEMSGTTASSWHGVDLEVRPVEEYLALLTERLAAAITQAWEQSAPGAIAYGLDYAVVGRNRRWVDAEGTATMYGLKAGRLDQFRHIEGYEDHSLNLLATYDEDGALTGLVVNLPCPSQAEGSGWYLSADFWEEARRELRQRFGEKIFILPQVSAAGELTSHLLYEKAAEQRMLELRGRTVREEMASRIADAVGRILPVIGATAEKRPVLQHRVEEIPLPLNRLTQADRDEAAKAADEFRLKYEEELRRLEADPEARKQPRWHSNATFLYRRMNWFLRVVNRFDRTTPGATEAVEVHTLRLGEIAFASNPFELYLDFGVQMKVRSPALQTFIIQLAGGGTYVPSPRSVAGGGYGSIPASNPFGPEAGQVLVDRTLESLRQFWPETVKGD